MKKVLGVFLAVGLLLTAGSAVVADKTFLSIATGGVAGTYYPLGGGLAQVMNSHVPDVEVTAETGNTSTEVADDGLHAEADAHGQTASNNGEIAQADAKQIQAHQSEEKILRERRVINMQ